ncbi:MAG TPA: F0F1 ATP synthase subunit A [Pirellulaceae bacterium]|jgi:F-type H+-transporting ATPase subunit a
MADPVLHIKDSYYFEVPKLLYPYAYTSRTQFPDVWISLDPEFQDWEAERLLKTLHAIHADLPLAEKVADDWHHWAHADHANFAKPLKRFLSEKYDGNVAKFDKWKADAVQAAKLKTVTKDADAAEALKNAQSLKFEEYLEHVSTQHTADQDYLPFLRWRHSHAAEFQQVAREAHDIREWKADTHVAEWSKDKIAAYNGHLSGKIILEPQPFATLRNLYEKESGFAISKYLLIEIAVGLILIFLFSRLAANIESGRPPKGKFWNLLEVFLVFIRDQIVRPSLGGHHEEDTHHPEHGHEYGGPYAEHGQALDEHGHHRAEEKAIAAAGGHKYHAHPADRFLPLLWTIFFFVLGCNLMGMVPWAGAPTAAFAVTLAMACVTFFTVIAAGMMQFGVAGFFLNQIPGMDLPWYMAIIIKPMILLIELIGLLIKHGVLAVRLFANLVAGHLVLLGIMGFAFGAEAALTYSAPDAVGWKWAALAVIAVVSSAVFSILELFVAFLQAYIFTFLTALFIGAAIHKH